MIRPWIVSNPILCLGLRGLTIYWCAVTSALIFFKTSTGFLLRVAQTRAGAGHVINAGLFQALKESRLFQIDPDLGIGKGAL